MLECDRSILILISAMFSKTRTQAPPPRHNIKPHTHTHTHTRDIAAAAAAASSTRSGRLWMLSNVFRVQALDMQLPAPHIRSITHMWMVSGCAWNTCQPNYPMQTKFWMRTHIRKRQRERDAEPEIYVCIERETHNCAPRVVQSRMV